MLEKATGAVQHTGGKRFEPDSEPYQTVATWIEQGKETQMDNRMPGTTLAGLAALLALAIAGCVRRPRPGCWP